MCLYLFLDIWEFYHGIRWDLLQVEFEQKSYINWKISTFWRIAGDLLPVERISKNREESIPHLASSYWLYQHIDEQIKSEISYKQIIESLSIKFFKKSTINKSSVDGNFWGMRGKKKRNKPSGPERRKKLWKSLNRNIATTTTGKKKKKGIEREEFPNKNKWKIIIERRRGRRRRRRRKRRRRRGRRRCLHGGEELGVLILCFNKRFNNAPNQINLPPFSISFLGWKEFSHFSPNREMTVLWNSE